MKSFDDLGFNNPNVYNWRTSVLQALESNNIKMSDFYFSSSNKNNKDLLQYIALKGETYVLLNLKGLINRGFCPITGEKIDKTYQYNIFKRSIYLSEKGLEVCKGIEREGWGNKNIDYDRFQDSKTNDKRSSQDSNSHKCDSVSSDIMENCFSRWLPYFDRSHNTC